MPAKRAQFIPRGMTRDLAVSKFNSEYAYENKNLRITATDENTAFVLSNEKGNSKVTSGIFADGIKGTPIGQSILNDTLILFTTEENSGPDTVSSIHNELGAPMFSIERYPSYEDAVNNTNGQSLTSAYSEGDHNYVIGEAGDYIAYKEGDYRIVAFSDNPLAIPILQINVDVNSNTLYYVTEVVEDEEPPFSNSVDFKVIYSPPKKDRVYKIQFNSDNNLVGEVLYSGNLDFSEDYPIESISIFENDELQKVYWVDGYNQPRVININNINRAWNNNSFEFIRNIKGNETVQVAKNLEVGGEFAPGVIQYYFTYFDMYGQETNIFASSPLLYTSYLDRGASPDSKISTGFNIKISNVDDRFDKIRIYSILRTSLDAVPQARVVKDIPIIKRSNNSDDNYYDSYEYIDTGIEGQTIDPTILLFKNRAPIVAGTLSQKDNTLFLGNIKSKILGLSSSIKSSIKNSITDIYDGVKEIAFGPVTNSYYAYINQLQYDSYKIKNFKKSDYYRLGVQFKHQTGYWSEAVYLNDYQISTFPSTRTTTESKKWVEGNQIVAILENQELISQLYDLGFREARPVIVYPSINDRECICQGLLCPTVYNAMDRVNNSPFVQSSWFIRPTAPFGPEYANGSYSASDSYEYRDLEDRYKPDPLAYKYGENSIKGLMMNSSFRGESIGVFGDNYDFYINKYGAWPEFRHNYPIPSNDKHNAEIQCITNPPHPYLGIETPLSHSTLSQETPYYTEKTTSKEWAYDNQECFYVDQSIVTFHSPDIEFNTELHNFDFSKAKLRIVGKVDFVSSISDVSIQTSTAALSIEERDTKIITVANGFYHQQVGAKYPSHFGWKGLIAAPLWFDGAITRDNPQRHIIGYMVYPWQRNGSLNNDKKEKEDYTVSSMLKRKVQSTLRFGETTYLNNVWYAEEEGSSTKTGISGAQLFEGNEMSLIKIPAPKNSSLQDIIYYGNIDKVIIQHLTSKRPHIDANTDNIHSTGSYPINLAVGVGAAYPIVITEPYYEENPDTADYSPNQLFNGKARALVKLGDISISGQGINIQANVAVGDSKYNCATDPVSMKYKSTPHAVIAFNYTKDGKQRILPYLNATTTINYWDGEGVSTAHVDQLNTSINRNTTAISNNEWIPFEPANTYPTPANNPLFWDENGNITGVSQDRIDLEEDSNNGYLWLGELYNDNVVNRFGGVSEEAFANNNWTPCGPSVAFTTGSTSITLNYVEGDTYFQRYDCLKTYPYTQEDQNSIVDIVSFECETRVNIDGRYDRNRGLTNNLNITPQNFNLLNPVYSQADNFLTYHGKDSTKIEVTDYPNTLTWTKTKTLGEEVDSWTDVTMASTLDLDGDLGQLRALRRFGDNIIAFQDNGISQILYNDNVQIASTTGVPIEIANSGKVSGKRYITNQIGCTNKWSICSTPNGLYFIDDLRKDFYLFNGQLNNISERLGFHSWMIDNFKNPSVWNPRDFDNCTTLYDRVNDEVLITLNDTALAFSENLNGFTSFYDYGKTPFMSNLKDRVIAWHTDSSNKYAPWMHHEGEYNSFYGEYKPFWTTVIVNPDPTMDKVFNNVEYRADIFDMNDQAKYLKDASFDTLNVWNEYQAGVANLENIKNIPSNLKKKFRIWRANIPRWNIDTNGQTANGRDRMRNPWLYLKLSMEKSSNLSNNHKTILHDMIVDYFE